jgi:purine-binding chemotaxis protein CheW
MDQVQALSQMEVRILAFKLCGQNFALSLEWVQEILPMAWLTPAPGSPGILEGFLNLRGSALPVLRLDRLFRLDGFTPGLYSLILVLKGPGHSLGLMVDEATGILAITEQALLPIREKHTLNDCVEAEVQTQGQLLHLLSPDRILLKLERERISGLQDMEQRRLMDLAGKGGKEA